MQTVLITGVNGFCARHMARLLENEGRHRIYGLDLAPAPHVDVPLDDYTRADVRNATQVNRAFQRMRPDLIFHLAGLVKGKDTDLYQVNVRGGIHVLEAVRRFAPAARVLIVGSAAEYGAVPISALPITEEHRCQPIGAYGVSKHTLTSVALDYHRRFGMKVVVARPFNVVGPGIPVSLVVGAVLDRAHAALNGGGEPVVRVGNLNTVRDFVAVEDVTQAYLRMAQGNHWGEVFNICSGQARSIRSVVERLLSFAPRYIRLEVDTGLVRPLDTSVVCGSWQKAKSAFGFQPTMDLDAVLRSAWDAAMGEDHSSPETKGR